MTLCTEASTEVSESHRIGAWVESSCDAKWRGKTNKRSEEALNAVETLLPSRTSETKNAEKY